MFEHSSSYMRSERCGARVSTVNASKQNRVRWKVSSFVIEMIEEHDEHETICDSVVSITMY